MKSTALSRAIKQDTVINKSLGNMLIILCLSIARHLIHVKNIHGSVERV